MWIKTLIFKFLYLDSSSDHSVIKRCHEVHPGMILNTTEGGTRAFKGVLFKFKHLQFRRFHDQEKRIKHIQMFLYLLKKSLLYSQIWRLDSCIKIKTPILCGVQLFPIRLNLCPNCKQLVCHAGSVCAYVIKFNSDTVLPFLWLCLITLFIFVAHKCRQGVGNCEGCCSYLRMW